MPKDTHRNKHRAGKRNFQAFITPEESELVDKAKKKTGEKTDRGLLVKLCEKETSK